LGALALRQRTDDPVVGELEEFVQVVRVDITVEKDRVPTVPPE
jgi:hypothetical protein